MHGFEPEEPEQSPTRAARAGAARPARAGTARTVAARPGAGAGQAPAAAGPLFPLDPWPEPEPPRSPSTRSPTPWTTPSTTSSRTSTTPVGGGTDGDSVTVTGRVGATVETVAAGESVVVGGRGFVAVSSRAVERPSDAVAVVTVVTIVVAGAVVTGAVVGGAALVEGGSAAMSR